MAHRYMLVRRVGKQAASPSGHPYRIIKLDEVDALTEVWANPTVRIIGGYPTAKAAREGQSDRIRAVISNVHSSYLRKEKKND